MLRHFRLTVAGMCVAEGVTFGESASAIYWYERSHPSGLDVFAQLIGYERDVTDDITKDGYFAIEWLDGPPNANPLSEPRR